MRKSRFSEEQIVAIIREYAAGAKVSELCRKHGMSSVSVERGADIRVRWHADLGKSTRRNVLGQVAKSPAVPLHNGTCGEGSADEKSIRVAVPVG